jgi:phosphohistidine phosphatase SixA
MRVYLVEHGESKSEEEDPQRRLTDKGICEDRTSPIFCVR